MSAEKKLEVVALLLKRVKILILKNKRFVKVLVWRVISIFIGTLVAFLYFGFTSRSLAFMVVLSIILTAVHYLFEKGWEVFLKIDL